jgi:hypothetical protein
MEELKNINEITSPDNRTTSFVVVNRETGQKREFRICDLHEEVDLIKLDETVPEEVRSQFNVARNLCLYSWYCYSFHSVACFKAYSTIEMALRIRLGKPDEAKCNLRPMLEEAVAKGILQDKSAPETIPDLRNLIAHGSPMNAPWSVQMLRLCAETINELFATSKVSNP